MNFDLIQRDPEPSVLDVVLRSQLGRLDHFIVEIEDEQIGEINQIPDGTWHWESGHQCSTTSCVTLNEAVLECYKSSQTLEPDHTNNNDELPF